MIFCDQFYKPDSEFSNKFFSATIGRLRQAWGEVKKQDKEAFEALTESLSLLGHYKNYREELKTLDPSTPVVPLIGKQILIAYFLSARFCARRIIFLLLVRFSSVSFIF